MNTHYINLRVAPNGKPANQAIRIGQNVHAPTLDDALRLLADSWEARGYRVVSIERTERGV